MERVTDYRRRVQSQHNASRPFNRLPAEIGCGIFATALAQERACAPYYRHLHQIRLVCSQWCRVIDAEPSFWTFLSYRAPPSAWIAILERSQTAPLRMDFSEYNIKRDLPVLSRIEFLKAAGSQIHRIKSLSILLSNPDLQLSWEESQALKTILETPAPLLEALHIHAAVIDPKVQIEFSRVTPRLRDVGVSDWAVSVILNSTSLINLQALSLAGRSTLPLARLRDVLGAAPNLAHLDINGCLDTNAVPLFTPRPIILPALKTVHIIEVTPANISSALTFFRAPSADYIALSGFKWMTHPAHFEEHFAQHIAYFIQMQPPGTVLRVRCWHVCVTINDKLFYLEGAHDGDHPYALRRTLSHLPPTTLPVYLSVEEGVYWNEPEELLITLDAAFPNTLELGLPSSSRLDRDLLGLPQDYDPPRWIFPNMKRLKLNGGLAPTTKKLRRAVKIAGARKEAGIPLESLHVRPQTLYHTPCFRRFLREADGVVAITCDAASELMSEPERRWFAGLDDGPPAGGSWWTIKEPEPEVFEPREYLVSTSDEEEPGHTHGSDIDTDGDEDEN